LRENFRSHPLHGGKSHKNKESRRKGHEGLSREKKRKGGKEREERLEGSRSLSLFVVTKKNPLDHCLKRWSQNKTEIEKKDPLLTEKKSGG